MYSVRGVHLCCGQSHDVARLLMILLQALLAEWRAELSRQPLALSESEACAVLGIKVTQGGVVSEDDMRKAYRYGSRTHFAQITRVAWAQIQRTSVDDMSTDKNSVGSHACVWVLVLCAQVYGA